MSTGHSVEESIALPNSERMTPASTELMTKIFEEELKLEAQGDADPSRARTVEIEMICKDGSTVWVEVSVKFIRNETGQAVGVLGISRDINERKQAEEALQLERDNLRNIFESIEDGIFIVNQQYDIQYVNPVLVKDFGYYEGRKCYEYFHDRDEVCPWCKNQDVWAGKTVRWEWYSFKNERTYDLIDTPMTLPDGSIGKLEIFRDITEHKKLEAQLRQAQKMESIGTLAGGIAHDFNNILYSLTGYTELALDDTEKGTRLHNNLQEVFSAAKCASDLVKQILTFSRQTEAEKKSVKVQSVVKEVIKLLKTSIPTTIEIRQNIDANCKPVLADPTQIHQVVMNLATNAYHAMREKGGVLNINVAKEKISMDDSASYPDLTPGTYIKLTVSDTGHGIDKAIIEKIFDPYFTTKPPGQGTGMGLSTIHGIVKSHGGDIKVYSEPGKGTEFYVYFPLIETKPVEPKTVSTGPVQKGSERILLVDDEEPIVRMVKQMLERLGYQVATRTSSVEALEAFRANSDKFDLVITDMTMPNMTGVELAPRLLEIRPDIPIILYTGFSEITDANKAKALGIREFLMKPIVRDQIARTIRKVLDE
jgi:PAS domain S-box-containing protein